MAQRIGIYGGTFDPIHFGHLNLAVALKEAHRLDEIWFIPARLSPHKGETEPVSAEHRLKMVQLAVEGIPDTRVLDLEVLRKGISYTVDTVRELASPDRDLFLMIGDDALEKLDRWYKIEEIIEIATLLVGRRSGEHSLHKLPDRLEGAVAAGYTPTPLMEISATEIRKRIKNNLYVGCWVPGNVLDYIQQHQLYC